MSNGAHKAGRDEGPESRQVIHIRSTGVHVVDTHMRPLMRVACIMRWT